MASTPASNKSDTRKVHTTPVLECQWAKVFDAEVNRFDQSKPPAWSIELLLNPRETEHQAFLLECEDLFEAYSPGKRRSLHAFPWQPHKTQAGVTVMRFRLSKFERKDGSSTESPRVIDAAKRPWPAGVQIGNGSKVQLAFRVYAWDSPSGAGLTFEPKVVMVHEHIPYENKEDVPVDDYLNALDVKVSSPTAAPDLELDALPAAAPAAVEEPLLPF
jgi:hypothetical protein